jgi:hypothetical protein
MRFLFVAKPSAILPEHLFFKVHCPTLLALSYRVEPALKYAN